MFTLRQKIFITSGIVVAILLIIVLVLFYLKPKTNQPVDNGNTTSTIDTNVIDSNNPNLIINPNNQNVSKPDGTPEELFVKQMARFFVERFFTYSNQNDNVHIKELQDSATASMQNWMASQLQTKDNVYSGVTTNVLSSKLSSFDKTSGLANVILEIKQLVSKEVNKNIEQNTVQKTVQVNFKLVNNEWKVDGIWDVKI